MSSTLLMTWMVRFWFMPLSNMVITMDYEFHHHYNCAIKIIIMGNDNKFFLFATSKINSLYWSKKKVLFFFLNKIDNFGYHEDDSKEKKIKEEKILLSIITIIIYNGWSLYFFSSSQYCRCFHHFSISLDSI